jgi:tetratricopeptide (TPR) repeat protein
MSDSFQTGLLLYSKGQFKEAQEEFLKLDSSDKRIPLANYYLGLCNVQLGNMKEAIKYYKKVGVIDTEHIGLADSESFVYTLYINMGSALLAEKEYQDAAHCFEEALRIRNYDSRVKMNLGNAYLYQKQHEKARKIFEELKKNEMEIPELHYCLGVSYLQTAEYQKAKESLEVAVKKQNRARIVVLRLYEAVKELGLTEEAEKLRIELIESYGSEEKLSEILEKKRIERIQ